MEHSAPRGMGRALAPALLLAAILAYFGSHDRAPEPGARFEYSRGAMGVEARIILHAPEERAARAAADAAFDRIAALERAWSDYDERSELRRLERESVPGEWREISADILLGLSHAVELATATGGAFDPTVGALTRLWREARASGRPPSAEAIAAARARVGIVHLEIDRTRSRVRFRRAGVELDLGGIGKGLAADEALAALRAHGCGSALVAIGGDIAVGDPPPGCAGWRIGIGDPARGASEPAELARCGISTSGDAEQHLVVEGVRLSHIVDPVRGAPLENAPEITVEAPDAASADGWATALSVDRALEERLRGRPGFRIWIGERGE